MDSGIFLKGVTRGYELIIKDTISFNEIIDNMISLFQKLNYNDLSSEKLSLTVYTGNRYLSLEQRKEIKQIICKYSKFNLKNICSNVIPKQSKDYSNIHIVSSVIRSGQILNIKSDVLFIGKLHQGGKLLVSGSIFIFNGSMVEGILHSGYPDDNNQIIVGDFSCAKQVHIGNTFKIIDKGNSINNLTLAYVNDSNILLYDSIFNLNYLKPNLLKKWREG